MKKKIIAVLFGAAAACFALTACNTAPDAGHDHSFPDGYEHSTTQHWHECECGATTEKQDHTSGDWIVDVEASATADGSRHKVCTVCDYITVSETIHTFTAEDHDAKYLAVAASIDSAAKFYYSCVVCGASENNADHTFTYGDPLEPEQCEHTFNELKWDSDASGHWHPATCEHTTEKGSFAVHGDATWTHVTEQETDKHEKRCPTCKYLIASEPCVYGGWVTTDADGHYKQCDKCGDKKDEAAHVYDEQNTDIAYRKSPATKDSPAIYYYSCECGRNEHDDAHTFTHGDKLPDEHTCEYTVLRDSDTEHWYECECGEEKPNSRQPHATNIWTPGEGGKHTGTCDTCHRAMSEDHTAGEWTADGDAHKKSCTVCGGVIESHAADMTAWAADATDETKHNRSCKHTGCTVTESGDHTEGDATDNGNGTHSVKCPTCDKILSTAAHTVSEWQQIQNDSVDHSGACSACGATVTAAHDWDTSATGADENGWVVTEPATESANGSKSRTCSDCGFVETADIPSLGHEHSYGDWQSNDAEHWKECSCGDKTEQAAHSFTNGACVCGKTNGFESFSLLAEDGLGATRTDTANSVKIAVTSPDNTDWHIKFQTSRNFEAGKYYEVTYKLNSTLEYDVLTDVDGSVACTYDSRKFHLSVGDNVISFVFSVVESGAKEVRLQLGATTTGFEVTFTDIDIIELTGDNLSDYNVSANNGATASKAMDGNSLVVTAAGTDSTADWHVKIEKNIAVEAGKTYEMTFVFDSTVDISGNTSYNADGVAEGQYSGGKFKWVNTGGEGLSVVTFRFTASETNDNTYACYQIGELTKTGENIITFYFINFREVQ